MDSLSVKVAPRVIIGISIASAAAPLARCFFFRASSPSTVYLLRASPKSGYLGVGVGSGVGEALVLQSVLHYLHFAQALFGLLGFGHNDAAYDVGRGRRGRLFFPFFLSLSPSPPLPLSPSCGAGCATGRLAGAVFAKAGGWAVGMLGNCPGCSAGAAGPQASRPASSPIRSIAAKGNRVARRRLVLSPGGEWCRIKPSFSSLRAAFALAAQRLGGPGQGRQMAGCHECQESKSGKAPSSDVLQRHGFAGDQLGVTNESQCKPVEHLGGELFNCGGPWYPTRFSLSRAPRGRSCSSPQSSSPGGRKIPR